MKFNEVKHVRNDLNIWHILARGGIVSKEDFTNPNYDISLLNKENKNGWFPVNLAKNLNSAELLFEETIKQNININNLIYKSLINNAESSQTKYDNDLVNFFIEKGIALNEAKKAGQEPDFQSRLNLAEFWLTKTNFNNFKENNPIDIAIKNSNSFFFFALLKIKNEDYQLFIKNLINNSSSIIGSSFFISERAFQLQQIIKQYYNINITISTQITNIDNLSSDDSLLNLEGF
jgi:hypothetical protein